MTRVATGLDRLAAGEGAALGGARVGLIANPTAVDAGLRHAIDIVHERARLVALFGPEHGLRGEAQYMVAVGEEIDRRTGVVVHSLYGSEESSLSPRPASLDGLDALVFDIQDVGSRYYTYVWTMVLAMRACAGRGIRFVVLDRPNPLGGDRVEGGPVQVGFESFVGLCSLPNRHGLTAGEIARLIHHRENLDVELEVIEMRGWSRDLDYDQTGLPWVMPSPNMPTLDTAFVYPGGCLLEGTAISEARGTTRPFELVGAPYVDGYELAEALVAEALPGVRFRPTGFTPTWEKHAGVSCGGVQLHVTDRRAFEPLRTGIALIAAVRRLYPEAFRWRAEAYEFVDDVPAFDLLMGSAAAREQIEAGARSKDIADCWRDFESEFAAEREPFLLYR